MSIRTYFENIAEAIREKLDTADSFSPSEMPDAIRSISGGGFVPSEYSEPLTKFFDTGIPIITSYTIECSFYASAYQNDGHIIGNMTQSQGYGFHLTTYSNRWYASNGSSEYNFAADSTNYPLYGKDILYRLENTGELFLNGISVGAHSMGTTGGRYALNTRGGGTSTNGLYKYKFFRVYDANNVLIHNIIFGTFANGTIKVAYDTITETITTY